MHKNRELTENLSRRRESRTKIGFTAEALRRGDICWRFIMVVLRERRSECWSREHPAPIVIKTLKVDSASDGNILQLRFGESIPKCCSGQQPVLPCHQRPSP